MFFPWVGMFEQLRLADAYVHYDDVQFSKGSFTNRVQIKTAQGSQWLTVPLRDLHLGQKILEVAVDNRQDWRSKHLVALEKAYAQAPAKGEMLALVERVYREPANTICDVATASMMAVHSYFEFTHPLRFDWASRLGIGGESSARVLAVVKHLGGDVYITGHGARRYLDHEWFEREGVRVEYMDYQKHPYPQLHGDFTPFVSILDLIANVGKSGLQHINSSTVHWKAFPTAHE